MNWNLKLFSANREKKDDEKNKQNSAKGTSQTKAHASATDIYIYKSFKNR